MKKIKLITLIASITFFSSCNSNGFEEHEIGENLIDKSTDILVVDTFNIRTFTVKMDSINTMGFKNVLVGQYPDLYFGKVSSDFYGSVDLGQAWRLAEFGADKTKIPVKFDSLVFIGYFDENPSHFIGDSLVNQKLSVHRILEKFERSTNKRSFKNHDVLDFDLESLGETVFAPKPRTYSFYNEENDKNPLAKRGGVRLRMKDKLGLDIIDLVNRSSDTILLANIWEKYFNGIVLKAGDDNSAMFSFQTGSNHMKIRLYYSNVAYDQVGVVQFHDFPISNKNFMNNRSDFISDNGTAQQLGAIDNVETELSADSTKHLSFIQGSLGLMTKVKISNIENLNLLGLAGGILNAELKFYPKVGSYDDEILRLPDERSMSFVAYRTDEDNKTNDPIMNPTNRKQQLSTKFFRNMTNIGESYYSVNLTNYVNNILLNPSSYRFDDAIILTIPIANQGNAMERLVIDNERKSDTRIRLEVTYVVLNN